MEFVPWTSFSRIVARYSGDARVSTLPCTEHFRIMAYAELTWRESLRDIEATLGANATIVCGVTVGEYAFVGAGAVVNHDVPDYALMVGVPARQIGWMSQHGERLNLPLNGNAETLREQTGKRYELRDGRCSLAD